MNVGNKVTRNEHMNPIYEAQQFYNIANKKGIT